MLTDVLHSGPSCKYVPTGALVARAASWVQSQLGPLRHTTHYTKSLRHTCGQHRPPAAPARKKFFRKISLKALCLRFHRQKTAPQCIIHRSAVITIAVQAAVCSCICVLYNYKGSIFLSYLKRARKEIGPFSLGHNYVETVLLG